jgi:hypothetical protein
LEKMKCRRVLTVAAALLVSVISSPGSDISPANPTVRTAVAVLLQCERILKTRTLVINHIKRTFVSVDRSSPMDCWSNYCFRLVDFEKEYGRSYDQLSRIFTRVVGHIFAAWSHLLLNNLAFFLRFDSYHTEIMDVLPSHLITDEIRRFWFVSPRSDLPRQPLPPLPIPYPVPSCCWSVRFCRLNLPVR